ncbi:MAG: nucleoside deaminase [Nitrospira sp.]|nr:nucleoside deaminase [Nitrospira sp.]
MPHRHRHGDRRLHEERRCDGDEEFGSDEEFTAVVTPHRLPSSPFRLPSWAVRLAHLQQTPIPIAHDRMRFVIRLAAINLAKKTGGPFGAAVFESTGGRLVAIGINLVESARCSHAHAEMVALANAQQAVGNFDLGAEGMPKHELVTSCEPCAMCYGAIPWSGVKTVLCGARASDAESIGFDEGPKPKKWVAELNKRGISVVRDLCRTNAVAVLQHYKAGGGAIYGTRRTR